MTDIIAKPNSVQCPCCETWFFKKRWNQKYCTLRCKRLAARYRQKERYPERERAYQRAYARRRWNAGKIDSNSA